MVTLYFIGLGAAASFAIVGALATGLYAINNHEIALKNYPLTSTDALFAGGVTDLIGSLGAGTAVWALVYILATIVLALLIRSERLAFPLRAIVLFFCAITFYFGNLAFYYSEPLNENLAVGGSEYNAVDNFNSRGFLYSFIFANNQNADFRAATIPDDYNPGAAREAISRGDTSGIEQLKDAEKPHIIMVRTGALSEVALSPHFNFAGHTDPLENWSRIRGDAISGRIAVPNFNGGTGDTEFDVLTGLNTRHFVTPYSFRLINSDFDSMATALNSIGYRSELLYSGHGWRYNRQNAYQHLGFDELVFVDDLEGVSAEEDFVSEADAIDYLIQMFEENLESYYETPQFHFGIADLDREIYLEEDQEVDPEDLNFSTLLNLPENDLAMLTHHFENVAEADLALARLHDYVDNLSEPVVLVYFADQLPPLSMQVYNLIFPDIHYPESIGGLTRLNTAPFVIWLNDAAKDLYGIESAIELVDANEERFFSASYLGSYLFEILDYKNVSPFFDFAMDLRQRFPVVMEEISFNTYHYPSNGLSTEELRPLTLYRNWSLYRIFDE